MASIRKRGTSWQVQVRRKGYPLITRTFSARADALAWARDEERAIDPAEYPVGVKALQGLTVGDLLDRYEREVTISKRGADRERFKLQILRSHSIAKARMDRLSPTIVARYRDDRLVAVAEGTVRRELAVLRHCFELARTEWGVPLTTNPVRQINLPTPVGS